MSSRTKNSRPVKYHGLLNQGATCYLNSVLQVLFMTKDFRAAVERDTNENPDTDCFDRHLANLFADLKKQTAHTYTITWKLGIIRVYEQQDAAVLYFEKILRQTRSGASQIFHGQLTHKTICTTCSAETDSDGEFWHLPLALVDSNSEHSVVDGIEDYFRPSEFSGENQIYCDECHAKSDATIKRVIKHHPEVLMLLLKRFNYRYMTYVKNYRTVEVPFTLQIPENQTYELYAVVDHFGDLRGGHYTATIKDDEGWYMFDDSTVTLLDFQPFQVDNFKISSSAYLLFYRKTNVHAADTQDNMKVSTPGGILPDLCNTVKNQDTKSYNHHESNEGTNYYPDVHAKKQRDEENVGGSAQANDQTDKRETLSRATQLVKSVKVQDSDSGKPRTPVAEVSNKHEIHYDKKNKDGMSNTHCHQGIKMNSWRNSYRPVKYHGLANQGATCYLNSVLQVLFMTEDFRAAVERDTNENPDTDCIDRHLATLFADLKEREAYTYKITQKLGIIRVYEQQDAAEYFEKILRQTRSGASQIFHGQLTHKTICTTCSTETDSDGEFWHLPLALVDSNSDYYKYYSVVDGIEDYFRPSEFSGENQIYCDECHAKSDATIKRVIKHHPEVLMLLLKRFNYRYMTYVKNYRTVEVPFTLQIPENQTYELYAVVDHFGSLRGGHYTAMIKDGEAWYTFDDRRVTLNDFQPFQVDNFKISSSAYLLFYRKTNVHAADTQDNMKVSTPGGILPDLCNTVKNQDTKSYNHHESNEGTNYYPDVHAKKQRDEENVGGSAQANDQTDKRETLSRATQLVKSVKVQDSDSGKPRTPVAEVSNKHEIHYDKKNKDGMSNTHCHQGIKMNSWRNSYRPVKYHGLANQGATCYLNSVLQVLFMTEDFRAAVERDTNENPDTDCIDRHLATLFADLKEREAYTYKITQKLGIIRVYEQQDAAEYFEKILRQTRSGASQIFHGQLTRKTICTTCSTETDSDGEFWHLPLALVDSNSDYYKYYSVVDGIEDYFRPSEFSGENQIYCDECHAKSDATIKRVIKHHPEVLMLLLKRFNYRYMTYVKNYRTVEVPFTLQIPENQTYELYAVVDHFGSLRGGHYTAMIKDGEAWYTFDDRRVTLNDFQPFQVDNFKISSSAYLLFYRKTNVHAADTQDNMKVSTPGGILPGLCNTVKNQDTKSYNHHESNEGTNYYQDVHAKKQSDEENVGGSAQANDQTDKRETLSRATQLVERVKVQDSYSGKPGTSVAKVSNRHEIHYVKKHKDGMSDTHCHQGIKMNSWRDSSPPVKYHGLLNQGATCYLNSVLQVLFMTEDFRAAVERDTNENPDTDCFDRHLATLFADLKEREAYTYKITQKLGIIRVYEQQDAAEYFEKILRQTRSGASQIFHGQLTRKTICTTCSTETDSDGEFWHLPLALVDSNSDYYKYYSVVDGIEDYFRPSEFSGENQIYCDECHAKSDATIKHVIKHHPEVLMLLLKRFEFNYRYMTYVKNYRTVEVPFTLQIPENQTYELYAVVDHFGSLRGGHYTAMIKDDEGWYKFDDSRVTLCLLQILKTTGTPTTGGILPTTTPFYDQCQDAGKMRMKKEAEGAEEEGNVTDVKIRRNRSEHKNSHIRDRDVVKTQTEEQRNARYEHIRDKAESSPRRAGSAESRRLNWQVGNDEKTRQRQPQALPQVRPAYKEVGDIDKRRGSKSQQCEVKESKETPYTYRNHGGIKGSSKFKTD